MIAKRISIALLCYFLFFRLYAIYSLFYSFIIQAPNESLIRSTNDGYQLTIFQLEFYFFLIILYSFRPSRFNETIIKSYTADGSKNFSKKTFFWIVYFGVLLVVFGIPLMIFKNALGGISAIISGANEYIIENTRLLIMSVIFLGLNMLGFYYDFINAFDHAKTQFFGFLFAFMLTVPISAFLYLISVVLQIKADALIIICLAFNLSFLFLSVMGYLGKRKSETKRKKFNHN
jgi:hypothetical protein